MTDIRPWYREPLVWLIIAFPLTAVIGGIATYIIADRTKDGLVVDDYYKQGKEINRTLARDVAAAQLGLHGALTLDASAHAVVLHLQAKSAQSLPPAITLRWLHATRAGLDLSQTLQRQKDGRYRAVFPVLNPGHWYVQLEAQDWRLQGSLRVPVETVVELRAADLRPVD
jgi:hypothetical protein